MSALIDCYPGDRGLDFLLVVTLVVTITSSAAWVIGRGLGGNAALRHLVSCGAILCCLASPAVAWLCGAVGLTLVSVPVFCGDQSGMVSSDSSMAVDFLCSLPRRATDSAAEAKPAAPHTNGTINHTADVANDATSMQSQLTALPAAPEPQPAAEPKDAPASWRGIAITAILVWAIGALLMFARFASNCGRVVHLRRSAGPLESEMLRVLLREIAAKLGMRRPPLLLVSSRTIAPLAVGCGRAAVILPERMLGALSANELRDVLMHEVAHLKRGDQWMVLLQHVAGALYWPIVSVHALNRELQRAREELCDNVVLGAGDAICYGRTLLHVAELAVMTRPIHAAVGIVGGPGILERRIAGLIDPRRSTVTATSARTACIVVFLFVAWGAIASATRFAVSAGAAAEPEPIAAQETPPVQKAPPANGEEPDNAKFAGHFSGRVTGPDGKPIQGARVFIVPFYGEAKAPGPVRAETDADGRFAFDAPDMTYTALDGLPARREGMLVVTKAGYAPDWFHTWGQDHRGLYRHWDPVKGAALNLQLAKDDVPIHGRLLDPDGQPLAGARVRLANLMVPRNRDLTAHLNRWSKMTLEFSGDYERDLGHRPEFLPGLTTETRTDADGRFKLSGLGRDRLAVLSISAPTVVDTTLTVMTRDGPDVGTFLDPDGTPTRIIHGAGFTLKLGAGRTIKGRVIDQDTREPITGMWVGPLQNAVNELTSRLYPWVSDAKGRFTITGLYPRDKDVIVAIAAPGLPYQTAWVEAKGDAEVLIECRRGIPFRLKLTDEDGRPVEAKVTYVDVQPNADVVHDEVTWPVSHAARKADGTYEGFVLSGPGAVLVETRWALGYRPACVDPKAFFAPGRTKWAPDEQSAYGTRDTLTTANGRYHGTIYRGPTVDQRDYTAIVFVNPPANSGPLQLSATVVRDRPRRVNLVDADGKPVVGVQTWTIFSRPLWQMEGKPLRAASFPLTGLHPDRVTPLKFVKEDRQLIGYLLARGDSDTAYSVRMEKWGTVIGRVLNQQGQPVADARITIMAETDEFTVQRDTDADAKGRFRADAIIPGLSYRATVHRGWPIYTEFLGTAADNLILRPGELRDLGDVRVQSTGK
jgi:beta-lactamase regulating signal transducer with metallopeptidase domain